MSSKNSAKRTNKSKLSFFQKKDSKKLKTSIADPVINTSPTSDTKGKNKANDNTMEVDSTSSINPSSNTTMTSSDKTPTTGLATSIYTPNTLN